MARPVNVASAQRIPRQEPPIYIDYLKEGDGYEYDASNDTAAERRPAAGGESWIDWGQIPAAPPAKAPSGGQQ